MTGNADFESSASDILVRDYVTGDYRAGRRLWVELTEHHRRIYGDPTIGGDDPGAGFDDYLTMDLRRHQWLDGTDLHGLDFQY